MAAFDFSRMFQGGTDPWNTVYSQAGNPATFDAQSGGFAGITPEASQGLGKGLGQMQQGMQGNDAQMQAQHAAAMKTAADQPQPQSAFAPPSAKLSTLQPFQPKTNWWEA